MKNFKLKKHFLWLKNEKGFPYSKFFIKKKKKKKKDFSLPKQTSPILPKMSPQDCV